RSEERGVNAKSFYPRRLAVLLGFGLIHLWLIWWGDILTGYALTGFVLFLFRKRKQKTLLIWAACLFFAPWVASAVGLVVTELGLCVGHQRGAFVVDSLRRRAAFSAGRVPPQEQLYQPAAVLRPRYRDTATERRIRLRAGAHVRVVREVARADPSLCGCWPDST